MSAPRLVTVRWLVLAIAVQASAAPALRAQGGGHMAELNGAVGGPTSASGPAAPAGTLRVCADPNNMPFSDRAGQGFENRVAEVLARAMHDTVAYSWWAQRRGFVRSTLNAHRCDVVMGIVVGDGQVLTTRPYYRSTYVFVSRRDHGPVVSSFDDPRLQTMRIGLHVIGADYNSLPPGVALARRGLVRQAVGYSIYGNYAEASPPSALISAVAHGDVDVAVAWGPLAGYYAARSNVPLTITPVATPVAAAGIPFAYDIAIGVRHDDRALMRRLDRALVRRRREIDLILRQYGVPVHRRTSSAPLTVSSARKLRPCGSTDKERTCA